MIDYKVKRNELKYYISTLEYNSLVYRLKYLLSADTHSVPHQGYFIRSLYFDSFDDESLESKLSGDIYRAKYRLRIYDINTNIAKFEIKYKANNQIFKESATISKESAKKIISGDYDELLKYNNSILNKIYIKFNTKYYTPKVIIDYYRDAFVFDFFDLRITIDKYLSSNNTNFDIFDKNIHTIPCILQDKYILEIKYNTVLPQFIQNILQLDAFERAAISKYTIGRSLFQPVYLFE